MYRVLQCGGMMAWVYEDMEVWYGVLLYDIMMVYIGVTVCVYGGMEWLILVIIVVPTL